MKSVIILISLLISTHLFAKETKYGIFDYGKVIDQTKIGKQVMGKMKVEKEKIEREMAKLAQELDKKYQTFEKQRALLNEKAVIKKQYELQSEAAQLEAKRRGFEKAFLNKQMTSSEKVQQELYQIVKTYADKNQFDQVYEKSVAPFYLRNKQDITDDIIDLMNKSYKK